MTPEQLEQIKARAAKATKGPWKPYNAPLRTGLNTINEVQCTEKTPVVSWMGFDDSFRSKAQHKANARFIAAARQDIPALIAEVRRLREIVADIERYYPAQVERSTRRVTGAQS